MHASDIKSVHNMIKMVPKFFRSFTQLDNHHSNWSFVMRVSCSSQQHEAQLLTKQPSLRGGEPAAPLRSAQHHLPDEGQPDTYGGGPLSPRTAPAAASSVLIAGDVLLPAGHSPDVKQTCVLHVYRGVDTRQVEFGSTDGAAQKFCSS